MSLPNATEDMIRRIAALRAATEPSDDAEITEIVRRIVDSLEGDLTKSDLRLYRELEDLATYIAGARQEITALRADKINSQHIPRATDELDAIVAATEDATHRIMEAAEQIEGVAPELSQPHGDMVSNAVTNIYEACGFQDITGQRISKVVNTLRHIERKIEQLVAAFGDEIEAYRAANPDADADAAESDEEKALLQGPQLDGEGQSQAEIDALLASFD